MLTGNPSIHLQALPALLVTPSEWVMAAQGVDHEQVMSQSSELRDCEKWSQATIILIINDPPLTEPPASVIISHIHCAWSCTS